MYYTPKPFNEGFLPEVDGHKIFFAEYGKPDGEVIVSLRGGPGSKSKSHHASRFNLSKYRVVLFDQRGCGKSTPRGCIEDNTIQDLVVDMERLRATLDIKKWFVAGSSWGSTLALVYAETHKEYVKGLLLSAIFQADKVSLDWFNKTPNGAGMVYADLWDKRNNDLNNFLKISDADGVDISEQLYEKITNGTEDEQKQVTIIFSNWESNLLSAWREVSYVVFEDVTEDDINDAKIFLHYEVNNFFLKADQIMKNIDRLVDLPIVIVHGRHDMICPFEQAWKLHQALPASCMVVVPQSNHLFTPDGEVARYYAFDSFLKDFENCKQV